MAAFNEEYAAIVIGYNQTKRLVRCADLHAEKEKALN